MLDNQCTLHVSMITGRIHTWDVKSVTFISAELAKKYCGMISVGNYIREGKKVTAETGYSFHLDVFTKPRPKDTTKYVYDFFASIGGVEVELVSDNGFTRQPSIVTVGATAWPFPKSKA